MFQPELKISDYLRYTRSLNTIMATHGITKVTGEVRIDDDVLGHLENVFYVNTYEKQD